MGHIGNNKYEKIKQYNAIGKDGKEILIQIGTASLRT